MEKQRANYVDKDALYKSLCEWKAKKDAAIAADKKPPALPDDVGRIIMMISERMAHRPNFKNYTYIDEMVGDAIVDSVRAMNAFDPERKGKNGEVNPFGFLSMIVWRAFITRIKNEKKIQQAKVDSMMDPTVDYFEEDEFSDFAGIDRNDLSDFYYEGKML